MKKSNLEQGIGWFKSKPRHNRKILEHLLILEWAYVPITSRILSSPTLFQSQQFSMFANGNEGIYHDIIMIVRDGLILPAFNHHRPIEYRIKDTYKNNHLYKRNLQGLITTPTFFHSTMGLPNDVVQVEKMLNLKPTVKFDHHLMTLSKTDHKKIDFKGYNYSIRQASVEDTELILPLREAYELEEVVINPNSFSRKDCRNRLNSLLEKELVHIAISNGKPISMATTSSRGKHIDQIGGVFTAMGSRKKGLATAVINSLLNEIFGTKKDACLFVKTKNILAINLYRKIGFKIRSDYSISYYT